MGSYGGQNGSGNGAPRRKIMTLTASSPAVQIPTWARGAPMDIWGISGGGNSGVDSSHGCTGAMVCGLRIILPPTAAVLSVTIGAGAPMHSDPNGLSGGATFFSIDGVEYLRLEGGYGHPGSGGARVLFADRTMLLAGGGGSSGTGSPSTDAILWAVMNAITRAAAFGSRVVPSLGMSSPTTIGPGTSGTSLFGGNKVGFGFGGTKSYKAGDGFLAFEFMEAAK